MSNYSKAYLEVEKTMPHFDKVVIVTGAASGLGLAVAQHFAKEGAQVVLIDIDEQGVHRATNGIVDGGGRAFGMALDISNPESVQNMVSVIMQQFGGVDVLVNNAGIGGLYHFLDEPFQHWQRTLDVNLTGVFLCGQAVARVMAKAKRGAIINVASVAGFRAGSGRTAYGTSKAAVIQLTRQMALDLGPLGITVNGIAPGPVDTPMVMENHTPETRQAFTSLIPLNRYGTPLEIAMAVSFLAGEGARYVNGQTLCVDGGFTAVGMVAADVARYDAETVS